MGNKSFESKLNNASHNYVGGTHYIKPLSEEDSQEKYGLPPKSAYETGLNSRIEKTDIELKDQRKGLLR